MPELVDKLRRIVEPTDNGQQPVQIVLSTFWRPFLDYVAYALWRHGVPGELVVDATPGRSKSKTCIQTSCVRHLLNPTSLEDESFFLNRAAEIRVRLRLLFTQPLKLTYPNSTLAALAQQSSCGYPQVQKFVILDDRKTQRMEDLPFFINGSFRRINGGARSTRSGGFKLRYTALIQFAFGSGARCSSSQARIARRMRDGCM